MDKDKKIKTSFEMKEEMDSIIASLEETIEYSETIRDHMEKCQAKLHEHFDAQCAFEVSTLLYGIALCVSPLYWARDSWMLKKRALEEEGKCYVLLEEIEKIKVEVAERKARLESYFAKFNSSYNDEFFKKISSKKPEPSCEAVEPSSLGKYVRSIYDSLQSEEQKQWLLKIAAQHALTQSVNAKTIKILSDCDEDELIPTLREKMHDEYLTDKDELVCWLQPEKLEDSSSLGNVEIAIRKKDEEEIMASLFELSSKTERHLYIALYRNELATENAKTTRK